MRDFLAYYILAVAFKIERDFNLYITALKLKMYFNMPLLNAQHEENSF